jgi:glycosyltransferase involved in cell wall biosynthesis
MSPRVAILIPVYNSAATLEATLASVYSQSYKNIEIFAVDDGSTDRSGEILASHKERIKVVSQRNSGGGVARNRLLAMSSAPFIQYLDADDVIDPKKIESQISYLLNHPETALITSTMRLFYHDPAEEEVLFRPLHVDWWTNLIDVRIPFTSAALWRRSAIDAVGGWDESLPSGQEYDLYFRLLRAGYQFAHEDLVMTRYRMPSRNQPPKRAPYKTIALQIAFLDRVESHLMDEGMLTPIRARALVNQRLQLARKLWQFDQLGARRLAGRLNWHEIVRLPSSTALPRHYLLAAATFGFSNAEYLAKLMRK